MKTTIGLCLLMIFIACTEPYRGFVLDGVIQGADNETLYLYFTDSLGNRQADSVLIKNGKFTFQGGIAEPTNAFLGLGAGMMAMDDPNITDLWIEPTEMTLSLVKGDFKNYVLKGSITNDEAKNLDLQKEPIMKELRPKIKAYYAEKDHEKATEMRDSWDPYYERIDKIDEEFMSNHPDSYVTAQLLSQKISSISCDEAQVALDRLSDRVKKSRLAEEIRNEIRKLRLGSPGSPATMFSKTDINGEMFNLADLKGKYVLIDFWASWCVPCRKSNPHLKAVYKKYRDKGFEVVCVSDDDRDEAKWKAAVEKDGIQEFKHVLRGLKWVDDSFDRSEDVSEFYGIHSLPTKILIDREGMIIGRYGGGGGTEADMDQKLQEIFGV